VDGAPTVTTLEERSQQAAAAVKQLRQEIARRDDVPPIIVPILKMTNIESSFSLADITEMDAFRNLGETLAANPADELRRTVVSAQLVVGPDGVKRTELITAPAVDEVKSAPTLFALEELRERLVDLVLSSPFVPARKNERAATQPIIDAFLRGLGPSAAEILSANLDRAAGRLVTLIGVEQRRFTPKPDFNDVVELREFNPTRTTDKPATRDRFSRFARSNAYEGWQRAIYSVEWFDSEPERHVANIVDDDASVSCWVRLQVGELRIVWNSEGREYNADLIVIEADGTHWIVEVKMDKEMSSAEVQGKREAAKRWVNHVNADPRVDVTWRYLLVSETDINTAKDSWSALKKLGV
jgi:type III restriction enzyme